MEIQRLRFGIEYMFKAFFQCGKAKVQHKPNWKIQHSKISSALCSEYRMLYADSLKFNDYFLFHK